MILAVSVLHRHRPFYVENIISGIIKIFMIDMIHNVSKIDALPSCFFFFFITPILILMQLQFLQTNKHIKVLMTSQMEKKLK